MDPWAISIIHILRLAHCSLGPLQTHEAAQVYEAPYARGLRELVRGLLFLPCFVFPACLFLGRGMLYSQRSLSDRG